MEDFNSGLDFTDVDSHIFGLFLHLWERFGSLFWSSPAHSATLELFAA